VQHLADADLRFTGILGYRTAIRMRPAAAILALSCASPAIAWGQEAAAVEAHALFFGDNTEFSNPFREGETELGVFGRVFLDLPLAANVNIQAGVFGRQVFGSEDGFDEVRPVLTLAVGSPRSRLLLGTLDTVRRAQGAGPDRLGPHGLLPPLQRETLALERPWEAGVQWIVDTPRVQQDMWLHWQRVQSAVARERFDAGVTTRVQASHAFALRGEFHAVHEGGQQSQSGPVRDSFAGALGVDVGGPAGPLERVSLESLALISRFTPDRENDRDSRTGVGVFIRLAAEWHGWRGHGLLARSNDFIKEEGDRHYQSLRRDGTEFRAARDYAEAGVTRSFRLGEHTALEASVRWHRVEGDYEYSYRLLGVVRKRWRLAKP
jgi:hypothetical protein